MIAYGRKWSFDGRYYLNNETGDSLHRYIWKLHNGSIPDGYHIHHIDGNKDNNDISNLLCVSCSEHMKLHRSSGPLSTGRQKKVQCIETGTVYESVKAAAKAVGIGANGIGNMINGRAHTAGGYTWRYVCQTST